MFPQKSYEDLEEIIELWKNGDQPGANGGLKNDTYITKYMRWLSSSDPKELEGVIEGLQNNSFDPQYLDMKAIISIMIAYAYCKLENKEQAQFYATSATTEYWSLRNTWNKALAFWFLGNVHRNDNNIKTAIEALTSAKQLLEQHAKDINNPETQKLCKKYMQKIEETINNLLFQKGFVNSQPKVKESEKPAAKFINRLFRPSPSTAKGPDETRLKGDAPKNFFGMSTSQPVQTKHSSETPSQNREDQGLSSNPPPNSRSSLFHIVIPVDIQAL